MDRGKRCIRCAAQLDQTNWKQHLRKNWVNKCDDCIRIEKREYARAWREAHPGAATRRSILHRKQLRITNPKKWRAQAMYSDARKRARRTGMEFDLTSSILYDLLQTTTVCPYFGWPLTYENKQFVTYASLDRIDSRRGYTKDNVRVISVLANLMKSNATESEMVRFARGVLRLHAVHGVEKVKGVKSPEVGR